jgi:EGF-like domain
MRKTLHDYIFVLALYFTTLIIGSHGVESINPDGASNRSDMKVESKSASVTGGKEAVKSDNDLNGAQVLVNGTENVGVDEGDDYLNSFENIDSCQRDDDCQNRGKCSLADQFSEFNRCVCKPGYGGPLCEDTCPLRCQNNGGCRTSLEDDSEFECHCHGEFTGDLCQIPFKTCPDYTFCFHGGTCVLKSNITQTYGCHCPPGYDQISCTLNPNQIPHTFVQEIEESESHNPVGFIGVALGLILVSVFIILIIRRYNYRRGYRRNVDMMKTTMAYSFDPKELDNIEML